MNRMIVLGVNIFIFKSNGNQKFFLQYYLMEHIIYEAFLNIREIRTNIYVLYTSDPLFNFLDFSVGWTFLCLETVKIWF